MFHRIQVGTIVKVFWEHDKVVYHARVLSVPTGTDVLFEVKFVKEVQNRWVSQFVEGLGQSTVLVQVTTHQIVQRSGIISIVSGGLSDKQVTVEIRDMNRHLEQTSSSTSGILESRDMTQGRHYAPTNSLETCLDRFPHCSFPLILFVLSFYFYVDGFILTSKYSPNSGEEYKGKGVPFCEEAAVWIFANSIIVPVVLLFFVCNLLVFTCAYKTQEERREYRNKNRRVQNEKFIDFCCAKQLLTIANGFRLYCYYGLPTLLLLVWFIYGSSTLFWNATSDPPILQCEEDIYNYGFWILFVSLLFLLYLFKQFCYNEWMAKRNVF